MSQEETNPLERNYWCFISYRHTDNREEGRQWANWLHQALETYEVPKDLVGKTNERGEIIPSRIFPVFRDEVELGTGSLSERISKALDHSKTLVVICSPRVLDSSFVSGEIRHFKKIGKSDYVYAIVVDGEPGATLIEGGKCFPDELRYHLGEDGQPVADRPAEPLAADFRLEDGSQGWTTPEAYERQGRVQTKEISIRVKAYAETLELGTLKLISGILGVPLGTLRKRDKAYQLQLARRRARIFAAVMVGMSILAALAVWQRAVANQQRDTAWSNEAQGWMLRAEVAEKEGHQYPSTLFYAARAIGFDGMGRVEKTGRAPLDFVSDWIPFVRQDDKTPRLWTNWRNPKEYKHAREWIEERPSYLPVWSSEQGGYPVTGLVISAEGRYLAISNQGGRVHLWDFAKAEETEVAQASGDPVNDLAIHPNGKL